VLMYTLSYENSHTPLPSPEVWCEDGPCLCPGTGNIRPGGMVVQGMRGDENELSPVICCTGTSGVLPAPQGKKDLSIRSAPRIESGEE